MKSLRNVLAKVPSQSGTYWLKRFVQNEARIVLTQVNLVLIRTRRLVGQLLGNAEDSLNPSRPSFQCAGGPDADAG